MYRYFNPNPCGRVVGDCAVLPIVLLGTKLL